MVRLGRGENLRWRQGEAVDGNQLRSGVGEEIDRKPGTIGIAEHRLLDRIDAEQIGIRKRGDRTCRKLAAAAVGSDNRDRLRAGLRDDGHSLVWMEAPTRHGGRQHPFAQVLHQHRKADAERKVRVVDVETDEDLPEGSVADQDQRRLQAGDQRAAESRCMHVLALCDVHVLQRDVVQQRIAGVGGAYASDAHLGAAGQRASGRRVDHDERRVRHRGR